MSHAVFTIVTEVRPGAEEALREVLTCIASDREGNPYLTLPSLERLHFGSLTVFKDERSDRERRGAPPLSTLLVFEIAGDGTIDEWVDRLSDDTYRPGLLTLYSHCVGCPAASASKHEFTTYLTTHVRRPNLHHVGRPHRRIDTVKADRRLREVLEDTADADAAPGRSASEVWRRLRELTSAPVSVSGELSPVIEGGQVVRWLSRPEGRAATRLRRWGVAAMLFLAALAIAFSIVRINWQSPADLTIAIGAVFAVHGLWTMVLLGWPALDRWRDPVNLVVWFAALGVALGLVPAAFRLAGLTIAGIPAFVPQFLIALAIMVILAFIVGNWELPTPKLDAPTARPQILTEVMAQEDIGVTNHMSAMVILRPGGVRYYALKLLLFLLEHAFFHTIMSDVLRGRLFDFATVHFAQWTMLDRTRYLFLSNYDHSWSRYLDDFGNIAYGLARLWGQADCSPGTGNLGQFKNFARTWMTPHAVWYQAERDLTVTQIWANEQLRRGLLQEQSEAGAAALLQRLVNAEERS